MHRRTVDSGRRQWRSDEKRRTFSTPRCFYPFVRRLTCAAPAMRANAAKSDVHATDATNGDSVPGPNGIAVADDSAVMTRTTTAKKAISNGTAQPPAPRIDRSRTQSTAKYQNANHAMIGNSGLTTRNNAIATCLKAAIRSTRLSTSSNICATEGNCESAGGRMVAAKIILKAAYQLTA